jgi:hypothetical protein
VTLTGSLPPLPSGSATVYAQLQIPLDINSQGIPQQIDGETVASETITSPEFSLPIPDSAALDQSSQFGNGLANFEIIVHSGSQVTAWGQSVPTTSTAFALVGSHLAPATAGTPTFQLDSFPAFTSSPAAAASASPEVIEPYCYQYLYGTPFSSPTTAGEVHVANATGVQDTFIFSGSNDETISFGISSTSSTSGFTEGGTDTVTNSIQGSGPFGKGTVAYVDTTGVYQEYSQLSALNGCQDGLADGYVVKEVENDGDVVTGSGKPPENPYSGGCINDALNIPLETNRSWGSDRGTAQQYYATAWLGFSFTDSEGFTSDVTHDYSSSSSSPTTYICGTPGVLAQESPILYNTTG